jgi:hypothetical protein
MGNYFPGGKATGALISKLSICGAISPLPQHASIQLFAYLSTEDNFIFDEFVAVEW